DDRLAADGLAKADRQLALHLLEVGTRQHLAQIDGLARLVGQLDADRVAAWNHGNAGRDGAHRAGDVVGERDHAARLDAGRGLELIKGDDGAGADIDDVALDAEIVEHAFEAAGLGFEPLGAVLFADALVLGFGEEAELGQLETGFVLEERTLGFAGGAAAWGRALGG